MDFIEIDNQRIYFYYFEGARYLPIKPVCEALGKSYRTELRKIKKHPIYGWNLHYARIVSNNRGYATYSLSEKHAYGWFFNQSFDNPLLIKFQESCMDILYTYLSSSPGAFNL